MKQVKEMILASLWRVFNVSRVLVSYKFYGLLEKLINSNFQYIVDTQGISSYSKTPLLRPPLGLRKNGIYIGVVLLHVLS